MKEGRTTFAARKTVSASRVRIASPKTSRAISMAQSQKGRERAIWFSHMRDCDSWIPSETDSPSGRPKNSAFLTPCSYMPWPASWVPEESWSSQPSGRYRLVRRVSPGPAPSQNGWTASSMRPAPKSKPIFSSTRRVNAFCCSIGRSISTADVSGPSPEARTRSSSPTVNSRSGAKISAVRAAVILGSYSSISASYSSPPHAGTPKHSAFRRASSKVFSSQGRNFAKSLCARASFQTCIASDDVRAISATSSPGSLVALS